MRVSINLATRPFADLGPALRRLRIAMGCLAVAALGLWLGLHLLHGRADKVRAQERTLDTSISQFNRERQTYRTLVAQPPNAAIIDQAAALNALIDKKAFSWTLAMEDLETVLPGGVQVSTLEPIVDKKDGHVTVHMRVAGPRDKAVDLVANLEHSRRFLEPRIIGESVETAAGSNPNQQLEPVSASNRETFDLLADYNPATPSEREQIKKTRPVEIAQPVHTKAVRPAPPVRTAMPPGPMLKPNPPVRRQPDNGTPHSVPPAPFPGGPQ